MKNQRNLKKEEVVSLKPAHRSGKNTERRFYFCNKKGDILAYVTKIGAWKSSKKEDGKISVFVLLRNKDILEKHIFTQDELFKKKEFKQGDKIFFKNELFIIKNLGPKPKRSRNRYNTHQHGCPAPQAWSTHRGR